MAARAMLGGEGGGGLSTGIARRDAESELPGIADLIGFAAREEGGY